MSDGGRGELFNYLLVRMECLEGNGTVRVFGNKLRFEK